MPRIFDNIIQQEIDKQFAGEPLVMVEVEWADGGPVLYADRKLSGLDNPLPYVVSISQIDTSTVVQGNTDSRQITVVLNDISGNLRKTIDSQDIHLNKVNVYLTFQGLTANDKALLFEGQINSAIVWDEGARTLQFDVISTIESVEAGFTMEDGDFPFIPPADRNKPWPLVFGSVCNMKTVKVRSARKGFMGEGQGVADPTIEERLCQARFLLCPSIATSSLGTEDGSSGAGSISNIRFPDGLEWLFGEKKSGGVAEGPSGAEGIIGFPDGLEDLLGGVTVGGDPAGGTLPGSRFDSSQCGSIRDISGTNQSVNNTRNCKVDPQCLARRFNKICEILTEQKQQAEFVKESFIVRGGEEFPQGKIIKIKIDTVSFTGIMLGDIFTVRTVHHPDTERIDNPPCKQIPFGSEYRDEGVGAGDNPAGIEECEQGGTGSSIDVRDGSAGSWKYFNDFKRGNFIWLPPGSEVILEDESDIVNIVSLIPGIVTQVAAYQTFEDVSLLMTVPTDLYSVVNSNFTGYDVVEVRLKSLLSKIEGENWGDDLYVSFISEVGPNPVDTIEWLINTYTDLSIDPASFNSVRLDLTRYPSNFYVKSRPSVLDLIGDVAYQCRCAVLVRDNTVFITYLPKEPDSVKTLTEEHILPNSFKVSHTETEDLETRLSISWKEGDAGVFKSDEVDFSFDLKHNVPHYGIFDSSYDYYTMNIFELVQKTATFWMIRNSNTWKLVEFDTPLTELNLDVFDCVTIDLNQFPSTKVIIQSATFDLDTNTVKFKAWTPIRSGEDSAYYWAWPAGQDALAVHPLIGDEDESGDGFPLQVVPPEDHPLRGGYDPNVPVVNTDGDIHPSDIGDEPFQVLCKLATGDELIRDLRPEFDPFEPVAEENFQDKLAGEQAAGGGGGGGDDGEGPCGGASAASCQYEVKVFYITPVLTTHERNESGEECPSPRGSGGPCTSGGAGRPCTGSISEFCHSFGSEFNAQFFRSLKIAESNNRWGICGYTTGVTDILDVGPVKSFPGTGAFGECDGGSGGGSAAAGGGDAPSAGVNVDPNDSLQEIPDTEERRAQNESDYLALADQLGADFDEQQKSIIDLVNSGGTADEIRDALTVLDQLGVNARTALSNYNALLVLPPIEVETSEDGDE